MPRRFVNLTLLDFLDLLQRFSFARQINAVHMHHTFIPRKTQFRGEGTIEAMRRDHVENRGFSELAQHITIAPDGSVWTGRSWNRPPASAVGHNGNSSSGPFMFETVGNFDVGQEALTGAQRETVLAVIVHVQKRFGLPPESLRFHNQMSTKSCPGTSIPYAQFLEEVRSEHQRLTEAAQGRSARGEISPFGSHYAEEASQQVLLAMEAVGGGASRGAGEDGELDEDEMDPARRAVLAGQGDNTEEARGGRMESRGGGGVSAEQREALRPHVINLSEGRLIEGGSYSTLPEDVAKIFEESLEEALLEATKDGGRPLRLLFFAHGGLVSEEAGLEIAAKHVDWWKDNGIYPLYFVWETGFLQTIGQLLRGTQPRGLLEEGKDFLVEKLVRALQGRRVWSGMKRNAEVASAPGGGADYTAQLLARFCARHGARVELHLAGHSAGSIFQTHFLEAAKTHGVPPFKSGHFLAPAVRVDTFHQRLAARIGPQLQHLTLYTMKKDRELEDHCAHIYGKSLLYLIYHALEAEDETDLLGLEECLRRDAGLKALFGLGGHVSALGEVVFSKTLADAGRSASKSTSHGGFDDDGATLDSVARRILALPDSTPLPLDYPRSRGTGLSFEEIWGPPALIAAMASPLAAAPAPSRPPSAYVSGTEAPPGGRRKALCVGIDAYSMKPLAGCVADARRWEGTLRSLGFGTSLLLDGQATWERLRDELRSLVGESRAGDVLVFQYSGHGTEAPDLDGDENGGPDQALCPIDFDQGRLLIDDDIAGILGGLPAGVSLTLFMDNCFSGDISRFALGRAARSRGGDERPRFLSLTDEVAAAHADFRRGLGSRAAARGVRRTPRGVLFAACQADELAWEVDGQGEFTRHATELLRAGIGGVSNQGYYDRVLRAFGAGRRQTPKILAVDDLLGAGLLAPLGGSIGVDRGGVSGSSLADELQRFVERLRSLNG